LPNAAAIMLACPMLPDYSQMARANLAAGCGRAAGRRGRAPCVVADPTAGCGCVAGAKARTTPPKRRVAP